MEIGFKPPSHLTAISPLDWACIPQVLCLLEARSIPMQVGTTTTRERTKQSDELKGTDRQQHHGQNAKA